MAVVSHVIWVLGGDRARSDELLAEAVSLLERHEPGTELAHAYALSAGQHVIAGRPQESLEWSAKAIELAERLGLDNFVERSRQFRGMARVSLGDLGGLDDIRDALRVALERGLTQEANIGFNNYGSTLWLTSGADDALPVYREGVEFLERRGRRTQWHLAESTWPLFDAGGWDEVLATAAAIEEYYAAQHGSGQPLLIALASKGRVLFYRGDRKHAARVSRDLLPQARAVGDPQIVLPALSLAALVADDAGAAVALIEEMVAVDAPENPLYPDSARVCVRHGALELAERMIRTDVRAAPRTRHVGAAVAAILAEARGEREKAASLYAEAARRWQEYPFVLERALALLGVARTAGEAGAAAEARTLFRSLGAAPLEREAAAAA